MLTKSSALLFAALVGTVAAADGEESGGWDDHCPKFAEIYTECVKLDGVQPDFFEAVRVEKAEDHFHFTTKLIPGFPFIDELQTEYFPDKVIRLGSDAHALPNGSQLMDLPSHESSYCVDDVLFRREATFLPDNTIAQELISMQVTDEGNLLFTLLVDGELALNSSCIPAGPGNFSTAPLGEPEVTSWDANCPEFEETYTSCQKLDGVQPDFFESLTISKEGNFFLYNTKLTPGFPIDQLQTEYFPDKVIRLGSDNHNLADGSVLMDLPSHETSYCVEDVLFRSETTFLPDNTIAQELISMELNETGELLFTLMVDGELALKASCLPAGPANRPAVLVDNNEAPSWDANCPEFEQSYSACQKLDGSQFDFFESVEIDQIENHYVFKTKLIPGLPFDEIQTEYYPDKVIRLGSDNHDLADGTQLMDLPSHETSYCHDNILFRSETTFLPDNSIAQELISMEVNDKGELLFSLVVDGELALKASCVQGKQELKDSSGEAVPEEEEEEEGPNSGDKQNASKPVASAAPVWEKLSVVAGPLMAALVMI